MGMIGKVVSSAIDGFLRVVLESAPKFTRDARYAAPPGIESRPIVGDAGFCIPIGSAGRYLFIGVLPASVETAAGEVRLFSRNSDGDVKAHIHVKNSGDVVIEPTGDGTVYQGTDEGGTSQYVALAGLTKDELDAIKSDIDAIKTFCTTHVHPAPTGPTSPSTNPLVLSWTPAEVAASNTKAKV